MKRSRSYVVPIVILLSLILPVLQQAGPSTGDSIALATPVAGRSFFGMNLYISAYERPNSEKLALMKEATDLGVRWSREEISWANFEPNGKGDFNWKDFDPWIDELRKRNIGIIGTIQTTPSWASGVSQDVADWYWHVPREPQDFADFAYEAARHYAGKIDVWEIWNEPDVDITFRCNKCDAPRVYAEMLNASYAAIKRANPRATVLVGGLSIHDYNNQGMAFLDKVVALSGGKLNFDVLSIHPYMPDRHPESTDPNTVVQNFQYRLDYCARWLRDRGAGNKEIWITEHGYSTCQGCGTLGVSEEEQARRLVRLHAIAMSSPLVTHFSYFQIEDKFRSAANDLWGNMAILRQDYSPKPAAVAYRVMTRELEGATFANQGPLMRSVPNRWQPQWDRYHYRFNKDGQIVHVIWKLGAPETVSVPVAQPLATVMESRGKRLDNPVRNGAVSVQISEDPIYVIEQNPSNTSTLDSATDKASPTGFRPSLRFSAYWQGKGGLPFFGYPLTGERLERSPTDGKDYIVQWFERARMEYHPEFAGTDSQVLLGLLGSQLTAGRQFPRIVPPAGVDSFCSRETGHCVWGKFLQRWRVLGVAVVGLPLSDQFEEMSTDGKMHIVQWFERARMEYHPQNPAPYDVLLGLLGKQLFKP